MYFEIISFILNKSQSSVMKILQNKFVVSHRKNKSLLSMISHMTASTNTAASVTAAIMILMQIIISVNTAKTGNHIRPDTEITTEAEATVTRTKTCNDMSTNLIIATQQRRKIQTSLIQPPSSSLATAFKTAPNLNSFHMSNATGKMAQPRARSALAIREGHCKFLTAAWGDIDPNVFYICDTQTKKPLQLYCPEGTGFFLGLGYSGCTPYEQWPACLSSGERVEQVSVCDSEHMQQPWEYNNPNKFYVCLKEAIEPTILNCEPGKGFVHTIVTASAGGGGGSGSGTRDADVDAGAISEIVGCANWEKWRHYMRCNDYY